MATIMKLWFPKRPRSHRSELEIRHSLVWMGASLLAKGRAIGDAPSRALRVLALRVTVPGASSPESWIRQGGDLFALKGLCDEFA